VLCPARRLRWRRDRSTILFAGAGGCSLPGSPPGGVGRVWSTLPSPDPGGQGRRAVAIVGDRRVEKEAPSSGEGAFLVLAITCVVAGFGCHACSAESRLVLSWRGPKRALKRGLLRIPAPARYRPSSRAAAARQPPRRHPPRLPQDRQRLRPSHRLGVSPNRHLTLKHGMSSAIRYRLGKTTTRNWPSAATPYSTSAGTSVETPAGYASRTKQ
jgi:hypothetical protein